MKCFFGHHWSLWEDVRRGRTVYPEEIETAKELKVDMTTVGRTWIAQERRCARCGMLQARKVNC